jgi:GxxExxY protein
MEEDFADEEMEPNPELNRWTNAIIGAAIVVHRRLQAGLAESIYENAMSIEFDLRGIPYERQVSINVEYRGQIVGQSRLDFLVGGMVVELKDVDQLRPVHKSQIDRLSENDRQESWNYHQFQRAGVETGHQTYCQLASLCVSVPLWPDYYA